ncbi:MAG: hypothetical protein IKV02_00900, partial [Clostridia bacterium]|nr:hypothetical protein [Clostridia bacterium]
LQTRRYHHLAPHGRGGAEEVQSEELRDQFVGAIHESPENEQLIVHKDGRTQFAPTEKFKIFL